MFKNKIKFLLLLVLLVNACGDDDRHVQYPDNDEANTTTDTGKPSTNPPQTPPAPIPVTSAAVTPPAAPKTEADVKPVPTTSPAPPSTVHAISPEQNTTAQKPAAPQEVKNISYYYKRAPSHWILKGTDEDHHDWQISVRSVSKTAIRVEIEKTPLVVEREMRLWFEEPDQNHSPNGQYFSKTERRGVFSNAALTVSFRRDAITGDCQADYLYDGLFERTEFVAYGKCY